MARVFGEKSKIMKQKFATKETKDLYNSLKEKGIKSILEFWDGHKHIDICIPDAKMYIEVDGLPHYTSPRQILADFNRDYYSTHSKFSTIHIPNLILEKYLNKVSAAIVKVVEKRKGRI
jgi:very-short-patch-repair endonuclease